MDGLKLTTYPTRKGEKEGAWYGDLCVPGNTAYLILGEQCLMRLALIMGAREMAARRKARIDKAVKSASPVTTRGDVGKTPLRKGVDARPLGAQNA